MSSGSFGILLVLQIRRSIRLDYITHETKDLATKETFFNNHPKYSKLEVCYQSCLYFSAISPKLNSWNNRLLYFSDATEG